MVWSPGPSKNNSKILETDSRDPETETGSLKTDLRVHGIHGTLETRITDDASQFGGPAKGAAGLPVVHAALHAFVKFFSTCGASHFLM